MKQLNIMGDIDDCLFPWYAGIDARCLEAGLHDGNLTKRSWAMHEDYGCSKEEWLEVIAQATADGFYLNEPPIPGSAEAWRRLYWAGHRLRMVTARGFMDKAAEIREWTPRWLEEFAIPYEDLTFAKDKVAVMETLGWFDYALDDGVHNYEALDSAGVRVYLLDAPHNQDFDAERRVATVGEFADIVLEESK